MIKQEKYSQSIQETGLKNIPDLFDASDIEYLRKQYNNTVRDNNWDFKSRKGRFVKNPRNKYYAYTTPLFNQSHTVAILYKEFYCGNVCAYGNLNIYINENGKWTLYKSILCWAS